MPTTTFRLPDEETAIRFAEVLHIWGIPYNRRYEYVYANEDCDPSLLSNVTKIAYWACDLSPEEAA